MDNLKELGESGHNKFRQISLSHDLSWRKREKLKEVRKAIEKLEEEKRKHRDGSLAENFRIICRPGEW